MLTAMYPALSNNRLTRLVSEIATVREQAANDQRADLGDDGWVLGTKAYMRVISRLRKLAAEPGMEWLHLEIKGLKLTIFVEGITLGLYRGNEKRLSDRVMNRGGQLPLPFGESLQFKIVRMMLQYDIDLDGTLFAANLLALGNSGDVFISQSIDVVPLEYGLSSMDGPLSPPEDLPPVDPQLRDADNDVNASNAPSNDNKK